MDIVDPDALLDEFKGINPAAVDKKDASVSTPKRKRVGSQKGINENDFVLTDRRKGSSTCCGLLERRRGDVGGGTFVPRRANV